MHTRGNDSEGGAMRAAEQIRAWFDALEDMVHVVDRDMRLVFANTALRKAAEARGLGPLRIGDRLSEAFPFLREELQEGYARVFRTGETHRVEHEERLPGGTRYCSAVRLTPVFGPDGVVEQVVTSITDSTARKEANETLRISEERYRSVVEDIPLFICRFLPDGVITFANEAYTRYYHRSHEELIGANIYSFMPEEERENERRVHLSRTPEDSARVTARPTMVPGRGLRWHRWTDRAIFEDGRVVEFQAIGEDITEQHRMTEALRESEERFRVALENSLTCLYTMDRDLRYTWLFNSNFGLDPGQIAGKTYSDFFPREESARLSDLTRRVMETGRGERGEMQLSRNGYSKYIVYSLFPLRDSTGDITGIIGASRDITELKRAEAALRESEERLRLVVENSPDTIFIQDRELRYFWITKPSSPLAVEEVMGKSDDDFSYVMNHEERKAVKLGVMETGEPAKMEVLVNNPDGLRWQEAAYAPYRDHDGVIIGIFGYSRDITARKRAEEALRLSEERYRIVSELVSDYAYCFRVEPDGKLAREWVTEAFRHITGFTTEEADQRGGWLGIVYPEDLPLARRQIETELSGKADVTELRILHKDGGVRWLRNYVFPVTGPDGRVERVYGAVQDITARKLLERNIEELRREYEAFMRHELKNLFIPLRLHADLLLHGSQGGLTPRQRECLEKIRESTIQGTEYLDSLRRIQELETGTRALNLVRAPLEPVVHKVLSDLALRGKKHGVEVCFDCRAARTELPFDPQLLPGVFFNLILNAIEHVENLEDPAEKVVGVELEKWNGTLEVRISNRGAPVPPERLITFFEKFNGSGKGQGSLGLGTAYARLVTLAHQGEIRVATSAEAGTTVTVMLPLG